MKSGLRPIPVRSGHRLLQIGSDVTKNTVCMIKD